MVRTGIDLGGAAVKLVRGHGAPTLATITHVGWEQIVPLESPVGTEGDLETEATATAIHRLVGRLGLSRRTLGRVAVGLNGQAGSFREVELPPLSEADLRRTLPFEARRHLDIEAMPDPVVDAQILGPGDPDPASGSAQVRVLLAAAPREPRDRLLAALHRAGLEADVVDLQPLAGLNAVLAQQTPAPDKAIALLDVGGRHAAIHVSGPDGALLSRGLGGGPPAAAAELARYAGELTAQIVETLTFYRGRQRREVEMIVLAGGGSLVPGLSDALQRDLDIPLRVLDPLAGMAENARGRDEASGREPLFLTACGLCRWWDGAHV